MTNSIIDILTIPAAPAIASSASYEGAAEPVIEAPATASSASYEAAAAEPTEAHEAHEAAAEPVAAEPVAAEPVAAEPVYEELHHNEAVQRPRPFTYREKYTGAVITLN